MYAKRSNMRSMSMTNVPEAYVCPITKEIMMDPLMNRSGRSYERQAIIAWITSGKHGPTCPVTKEPLHVRDLLPNNKLRKEINVWRQEHGCEDTMLYDDDDSDTDCIDLIREREVMHSLNIALNSAKPNDGNKKKIFSRLFRNNNNNFHAVAA